MERKNLALEALKKLINGEIISRSKSNVVEARTFFARLEEAVARYHANAISTVEMIQFMIDMAKDIRASVARGDELGLSQEELAFYDALAANDSAVEAMGNEQLRVIAHELVESMRASVTIDWHKKVSARAKMRTLVRRILKKYGYPPDLEAFFPIRFPRWVDARRMALNFMSCTPATYWIMALPLRTYISRPMLARAA